MTVVAATGGPSLVTYVLAVARVDHLDRVRPAQAALMPSLATTPEELTASNLALNTISGVGMFAGPAIAGVVLAFSGADARLRAHRRGVRWSGSASSASGRDAPPETPATARSCPQLLAGFRAIGADRALQVVIGLVGAQMFVARRARGA